MKKIILVSDTSPPEINGVATTFKNYINFLKNKNVETVEITSNMFDGVKCPFSKDLKLAYNIKLKDEWFEGNFAVHILTEGPLGVKVRNYCVKKNIKFTTSYLTMFPEFLKKYIKLPVEITRKYFIWFHKKSSKVLCCTKELTQNLKWLNHKNLKICPKGVDVNLFKFKEKKIKDMKTILFVGRISKEKNIEAFCELNVNARKVVIGDGPEINKLKEKYQDVNFCGKLIGKNLVEAYQQADLFVFPSKTDTYGIVMLEALSCGTPVAAYPINGALDLRNEYNVFCDEDLSKAVEKGLKFKDYNSCRLVAEKYDWNLSADKFLDQLIFN